MYGEWPVHQSLYIYQYISCCIICTKSSDDRFDKIILNAVLQWDWGASWALQYSRRRRAATTWCTAPHTLFSAACWVGISVAVLIHCKVSVYVPSYLAETWQQPGTRPDCKASALNSLPLAPRPRSACATLDAFDDLSRQSIARKKSTCLEFDASTLLSHRHPSPQGSFPISMRLAF